MSFWFRWVGAAFAVWFSLAAGGCTPSGQDSQSEEKEPHFVLGKSRVNAMDYDGAIEAFEQSLEADPHSAAAHFELGWLYDEKRADPAAAIFHYREYLKLDPNADNADVIKQRIYRCKQQLAADVLPLPSTPAAQQQLEKLSEQNRQLQDEVNKWRAYYASQSAAATRTNPPPETDDASAPAPAPAPQLSAAPAPTLTPDKIDRSEHSARSPARATANTGRVHTVAAGETAMAICRRAGVKLNALQAANPGVNLTRLRAGQVLNLPAP